MRTLGKINVLGNAVRVVVATSEEAGPDNLTDADHASYQATENAIYLSTDCNREATRTRENIVHESTHAWLEASGAAYYLKQLTGLRGDTWDEAEEVLVRMLAPAISGSLNDLHAIVGNVARLERALK